MIQQIRSSYFVIFHSVSINIIHEKNQSLNRLMYGELHPLEGDYTFYSTPHWNIPSSVNEILTSLESWLLHLLLLVVPSLWFRVIFKSPAQTRISTFSIAISSNTILKSVSLSRGYIYIDQNKWYVDFLYRACLLSWSNLGLKSSPRIYSMQIGGARDRTSNQQMTCATAGPK